MIHCHSTSLNTIDSIVDYLNMFKHRILPRTLMITGANPSEPELFIKKCIFHFQHGIKLIQLRAKELQKQEYCSLAKKVLVEAQKYNVQVILNCEPAWAQNLESDGLHLSSMQLMQTSKKPLSNNHLLSASCHNQEQLVHAQTIGVDFVTLSPVQETQTHPEATPLGWDIFATLCQSVEFPVYALGGITAHDHEKARAYGAYGIAAIRSLWGAA